MNFKNINLLGLNTYASHRVTEKNYLLDCNNIVADQMGVIRTRRGQSFFGGVFTAISKIFTGINELFLQADDNLYYDNSGTFTAVTFPDTDSFNPLPDTLVNFDSQNKSLFFNGKRISDDSSPATDLKIKKLTSGSATVSNSGLEAPINLRIVPNDNGGGFAVNDSFRVRVFYQYTDVNNYLIQSAVSESVVAFNDTGSDCDFILSFQIPVQMLDKTVDIYYAISNTVNNFTPDDNLFWSQETLIERAVNINVGVDSVYTFGNFLEREFLTNPVDLYTNASQEGVLQNNEPPLSSTDIETYSGYTFFSDVKDRLLKRVYAVSFPLSTDIIVLDGITYQRKATSDYSASPVEFSGDSVIDYTMDLARAITATQTKYRAVYEQSNFETIGEWQIKAGIPSSDQPTPSAVVGNNIWVFAMGAPDSTLLQSYNTITGVWRQNYLAAPTPVSSVCLQAYNNKLYSVSGLNDPGSRMAPTQIYDINTNTWTTGTILPSGGSGIRNSASAISGAFIYVIGGTLGGFVISTVYRYDIVNNSWTTLASLPVATTQAAAVAHNGYIYFVGGLRSGGIVTDVVYRYDITGNSWSTLASLPAVRCRLGIAYYDGFIYALNGSANTTTPEKTVYKYSISDNTWETIEETNYARLGNSGATVNNTIYTFGGSVSTPSSESFQVDGLYLQLQEKFIGDGSDITYTSSYITDSNFEGTSSPLFRFNQNSTLQYSKQGQPEAVPFFNNFQVGSASSPIIRIAALRSSLIILKTDGLYQLNGVSPETFGLQQLDPTCQIIAAQSLAKLDNEIYCLTSEGVVAINESGARVISYQIKDLIDAQLYSVPEANWNTAINGTAYDLDYKYILTIGDKTFTYNYITEQWTIWHAGNSDIQSWTVFGNKLYYATSTRVLQERKTFSSSDFQDENGDGIQASMEFNNLEFSPGKIVGIQAMQILQRDVSNLTVSITSKNDFNTPSPFTKLLDKFVSRVMFRNTARTAFYFRPTISWSTEIVEQPGTFSDSSFEGLDFEFEITESNIT